jgi:hypothetical protein
VVLGSGVVDGDILIVDDPNLEIWAFREKGFDCTVDRFEADSPQRKLTGFICLPFECKIKLPMVFEPCHRSNRSLGKRHGENFIRVVYFDHDGILGYGVGKVKPLFWGKLHLYNVGFFGAILTKVEVYHCEL